MSRKVFAQISTLALLLLAFLVIPTSAQAGGVCGGTYVVDAGDTLSSIASRCGVAVSAITTANPGVTDPLRAGQTLTLSGTSSSGGGVSSTIVSTSTTTTTTSPVDYNYYAPPVTYSGGSYIVQYGDTFSAIASRFGVNTYELWGVNPQIWDINYLYAGQLVYIPAAGGQVYYTPTYPIMVAPAATEPLSYGTIPAGTPHSGVRLVNKSSSPEIYVSLQGITRDGINVIYEYPVGGFLKVNVPTGDYTYVAWVNSQKFVGSFHLGKDSDRTVTFSNNNSSSE